VRSVQFIAKRRGYYCNLSVGIAFKVRFTTNGMCTMSNIQIYVARTSNNRVISLSDLYCCLLQQCEALPTCCSSFDRNTRNILPYIDSTLSLGGSRRHSIVAATNGAQRVGGWNPPLKVVLSL